MKLDDFLTLPYDTETQKSQYKHFTRQTLLYAAKCFEQHMITREQLRNLVYEMRGNSVDDQQRAFFNGFLELLDKVEKQNDTG
jgi:hypothetical protein